MKDKDFNELCDSIKEGGAMRRGIRKQTTTVDLTRYLCKWCGGLIKIDRNERVKNASSDVSVTFTNTDEYHEACWLEATEVQI